MRMTETQNIRKNIQHRKLPVEIYMYFSLIFNKFKKIQGAKKERTKDKATKKEIGFDRKKSSLIINSKEKIECH